jgi:DNA-directed RNA polymerase specialized sigma24 family protein
MSQPENDLHAHIRIAAQQSIARYARNLLDVEILTQQMMHEWQARRVHEEQPTPSMLMRIGQRICSRTLLAAWKSSDEEMRNYAYENLRRYLGSMLQHTRYAGVLQYYTGAAEDILHQTLETLQAELTSNPAAGPVDAGTFLKWTQTILFRQAYHFVEQLRRDSTVSLDAQGELFAELFVDKNNQDPLEQILVKELQQELGNAILSMRNQRYRLVLTYTFLTGLSDYELAERLHVPVQDIYLWRYRALKALRNMPEVMELLRSLLEE